MADNAFIEVIVSTEITSDIAGGEYSTSSAKDDYKTHLDQIKAIIEAGAMAENRTVKILPVGRLTHGSRYGTIQVMVT